MPDAGFLRDEQEVGDRVAEDAVDLLGHRPVEAAQAGFDVGHLRPASVRVATFAAASAQAMVEFTSPTTTTRSGSCSYSSCSKRSRTRAVWAAWLPEPTFRLMSGSGSAEIAEKAAGQPVVVVLAGVDERHVEELATCGTRGRAARPS